jgi:hypothetical protein
MSELLEVNVRWIAGGFLRTAAFRSNLKSL